MKRITEKDFSFICPMDWEKMPESENGRFCASCRKEVFDLSNCSPGEVRELQRKHGSICGSIKVVRAAAVAASLTAAACQDTTRLGGTPLPPPRVEADGGEILAGMIAPPQREAPANEPTVMGKVLVPGDSEGKKGE